MDLDVRERPFARLLNQEGELIAEGVCHIEELAGTVTLEAAREPGVLLKQRGALTVELETGESFFVSDRPLVFRIWSQNNGGSEKRRRTLYRFHILTAPHTSLGTAGMPEAAPEGRPVAR